MQLQRIRDRIAAYARALPQSPDRHIWAVQADFQRHWDLDAADLAGMLDRSLNSDINRRLWSRENYQPKAALITFARMEPDQVRLMFRDLFREERELQGRIARFRFLADELVDQYREEGRRPPMPGHDMDEAFVTLWLAMKVPARYAPYDHAAFVAALRDFGAKDIPVVPDPERWVKVSRTLQGLLLQDPALTAAYAAFREDPSMYREDTLLLAWDFVRFVARETGAIRN